MRALAKVTRLREYAGGFEQTEERVAKEIVALLNQSRKNIIDRLADIAPERFEAQHLRALMAEVDVEIERLTPAAGRVIAGGSDEAFQDGAALIDKKIAKTPLAIKMPMLDEKLLKQAVEFQADKIKDITTDLRKRIRTEVQLGVLGAKTPADVRAAIGTKLLLAPVEARPVSIFGNVAAQAERIARTEVGRVYSLATDERLKQVATIEPRARKFWIATPGPMTRDSHIAAGDRYSEDDPIPVDEPFRVGGADLMFPRDPAGPPEETINCRCDEGIVLPDEITEG